MTGDAEEELPMQRISKLVTLTLALGHWGDQWWPRVDREPSGEAFNSIV